VELARPMGIYDRQYYQQDRQSFASLSRWSVNTWIIVANVAVFLLRVFAFRPREGRFSPRLTDVLYDAGHFSNWTVLTHENPATGRYEGLEFWRFITFQFLHADIMHVALNMLGLYIFGGMVEDFLGRKKYLAFYLVCGIFGGLMYLLLSLGGYFFPRFPMFLISDPRTPLVGASAGVFGVILACAYIAPNMQVQLLFPPIPMRVKTLAYVYVLIAVLSIVFGSRNAGGEAAHLGGAAAGAFFIRNSHLLRDFFDVLRDSRKTPRPPKERRAVSPGGAAHRRSEGEVDRILQKVKDQGLHSLTEGEKRTLARDTEEKRARG
jgi:membrane associated rhomboid family serine protease